MEPMAIPEQLKYSSHKYPALVHKIRPTVMKNDIKDVLTNI